jgi:DNA-binding MarR family transcriptional regulator
VEGEKWAKIPERMLYDRALHASDIRVYGCLERHKNRKTGKCFPSISRISKLIGSSRRRVIENLKNLEKGGFITVRRAVNRSNQYTLFG